MPQSKSKRATQTRRTDEPRESLLGILLQAAVASLLVARLLLPAESAAAGDTLWVVQFWMAAGLLWFWNSIRQRDFRVRADRFDIALWVVVAGHVAGMIALFYEGGNKRAAINLSWEWVGLAVSFFLIRQTVTTVNAARRLVTVMLTTAVCLAGLGLWQHYVFYPQTVEEYDRKSDELERLLTASPPRTQSEAAGRLRRLRELHEWFITRDIPPAGPARLLWEQRLRSSTEPFGMFALANTFAGFLLVWLVVALSLLGRAGRAGTSWWNLTAVACATTLLAFCLILTKSRTAWVGLAAALAVWGAIGMWGGGARWKTWLWGLAAAAALLVAMLFAAAVGGGLDREVVAEAPKSLRYRLQYWTGTVKLLRARPLLGTGPGNFRQRYLQHKPPESSEAIADPHNFLLDLWANGGMLAVIGLFACIAAAVHSLRRHDEKPRPGERPGSSEVAGFANRKPEGASAWDPLTIGAAVSCLAVFLATILAGEGFDLRLPAMMVAWILVYLAWERVSNLFGVSGVCLMAAALGLFVHLLGAGGIEMPAIVQTFLVLFAVGCVIQNQPDMHRAAESSRTLRAADRREPGESRRGMQAVFALGGLFVVLFVGCFFSATKPVLNSRALLSAGESEQIAGRGSRSAARLYTAAAEADPLSPDPPRRLAELSYLRWQSLPGDSSREFERAVRAMEIAVELDPFDYKGFRQLGRWHRERYKRTDRTTDAVAAVDALGRAVELYPTHAALRAELAAALADAGNTTKAGQEAAAALKQDRVNRREGHRDQYLPQKTLDELNELARSSIDSSAAAGSKKQSSGSDSH